MFLRLDIVGGSKACAAALELDDARLRVDGRSHVCTLGLDDPLVCIARHDVGSFPHVFQHDQLGRVAERFERDRIDVLAVLVLLKADRDEIFHLERLVRRRAPRRHIGLLDDMFGLSLPVRPLPATHPVRLEPRHLLGLRLDIFHARDELLARLGLLELPPRLILETVDRRVRCAHLLAIHRQRVDVPIVLLASLVLQRLLGHVSIVRRPFLLVLLFLGKKALENHLSAVQDAVPAADGVDGLRQGQTALVERGQGILPEPLDDGPLIPRLRGEWGREGEGHESETASRWRGRGTGGQTHSPLMVCGGFTTHGTRLYHTYVIRWRSAQTREQYLCTRLRTFPRPRNPRWPAGAPTAVDDD